LWLDISVLFRGCGHRTVASGQRTVGIIGSVGDAAMRPTSAKPYRRRMNANVKIAYDVYRGKTDPSLRLATAPGGRLPAHVKAKDWVLMPVRSSPLHSDAPTHVGVQGYCFFQISKGK
jgi:hypothetical protein